MNNLIKILAPFALFGVIAVSAYFIVEQYKGNRNQSPAQYSTDGSNFIDVPKTSLPTAKQLLDIGYR